MKREKKTLVEICLKCRNSGGMCGRNKQKSNYLFSIYLGGKNPIKQKKAHYEMDMFFG